MPPLRLFIIPPTDNSLSYSAAKVKDFWAKGGLQGIVQENSASSVIHENAKRTVLGPKKQLDSAAGFMAQGEGTGRRQKGQWPRPDKS